MTRIRWAVVFFVAVLGMTFVGCNGGGGNESGGGGNGDDQGGGSPETDSERAEAPPNVEGTWVGRIGSEDSSSLMLTLDQEGESLSGYGTIATMGEDEPIYLNEMSGTARPSGVLNVTEVFEENDSTVEPFSFDMLVEDEDFDTIKLYGAGEDGSGSNDLTRLKTYVPEGMGLAVAQAVYSRDWVWLSERVTNDYEENLEYYYSDDVVEDSAYDEVAVMLSLQYENNIEDGEPALGARVELDEESVVYGETPDHMTVEFDYETSQGETGDMKVWLSQAGTSSSRASYQVDIMELDGESFELNMGSVYP